MTPDALALAAVDLAVANDDAATLERIAAQLDAEDALARGRVRYGTPEWDTLPRWDPRRTDAVRVAAEAWRVHCSPGQVAIDMAQHLDDVEAEVRRRVQEASWDVSMSYPWDHLGPSHAEIQERRSA